MAAEIRKFSKLNKKEQISFLLHCLSEATREHPDICRDDSSKHHKTNFLGMACKYGDYYGVKESDFEKITEVKVNDLVGMFDEGFMETKETETKTV